MCLIIASQNGIIPDDTLLNDAFDDNPDGWGVMWAENGKIHAVKGLRKDSMIRNVKKLAGKPFILHTRWATHGKVGVSNCHPFKVDDDLWIAHNGIIHDVDIWKKEMSDTWHFAYQLRLVAREYPYVLALDYRKRLVEYVEKWVGYSNKVVMLRSDGTIQIANERAGTNYDGMWLSNSRSLWKARDLYDYRYQPSWKPIGYYTMPTTPVVAAPKEINDSLEMTNVVEYADEQQCDYCADVARVLFRHDGCEICADCYEAEIEIALKWKNNLDDNQERYLLTIHGDDEDDFDNRCGLGGCDDDDFATGLEDEMEDLRGQVVCIDRGNYRLDEVPFSTVN